MLFTVLSQANPQELQSILKGEQPVSSGSGGAIGAIFGISFGLIIGILAVVINYRRNYSVIYAILAFFFSEVYLAFVFISFILKKLGM